MPAELASANPAIQTLGTDLAIVTDIAGADVVHSHTWYANFAGHLASLLHGIPHIVTAHSLEPLRPWKAEQLGGGYAVSSYIEKTAYEGAAAIVAVSEGMRGDILRSYPSLDPAKVRVIYNGIDVERVASASMIRSCCAELGMDATGRRSCSSGASPGRRACRICCARPSCCRPTCSSCCARARPTPRRSSPRWKGSCSGLQETREGVVWIDRLLSRHELCTILSAATTFVCPSVYEPLGIVNLEAMACGAAVVGTATGGIPEVVVDGVTGRLVPIEQVQDGTGTPMDPDRFVDDLARVAHRGRRAIPSGRARTARRDASGPSSDFSWARSPQADRPRCTRRSTARGR